jgi:hypothetical protein
MLLREEITKARDAGDRAALEVCADSAQARHHGLMTRIVELANRLPGDEVQRGELRAALNSIKYFQKLLAELR